MRRSAIGILLLALVATNVQALPASAVGPGIVRDGEAARMILEATGDFQPDTTTEPSIAVNPENPLNAVAAYQAGRHEFGAAQYNGYATTFDGGVTWEVGVLPNLTVGGTYDRASDPVVAFGSEEGLVYALSLLVKTLDPESLLFATDLGISVSTDSGRTWSDPRVVPLEQTSVLDDKPWIAVDTGTGPGHHTGRLYLAWSATPLRAVMYSDDQGQTWHGPFDVPGGSGLLPLVLPNGDLGVVSVSGGHENPRCEDPSEGDLYLISFARGAGEVATGDPLVFSEATTISDGCWVDVRQQREGDGLPTAAVDPASGRIYVSWTDTRFRTDGVHDIVVAQSDDGATWSAPKRIHPPGPDYLEHFTPALAVGADGIVRISFRTQQQAKRTKDNSPFVDTIYQQSLDGGSSWSDPLLVNQSPTDIRFAAHTWPEEAFLGDYSQVAVAGSWAYVIRAEAFRLDENEKATFPASVTHQRSWVAVIDSDGDGTL